MTLPAPLRVQCADPDRFVPTDSQISARYAILADVPTSERTHFMIGWMTAALDTLDERQDAGHVKRVITDLRALVAAEEQLQEGRARTAGDSP